MTRRSCGGCGANDFVTLFSLGQMPPVNAFLKPGEVHREKRYELEVCWCPRCLLVQLAHIVPPEALFTDYQHLSSASGSNLQHLASLARDVKGQLGIKSQTKILEVGSNDGSLLAEFHDVTTHLLGVDPAKNLSPIAHSRGIETFSSFLNEETGKRILAERGPFDLILALNVVAHTPDVIGLFRSIRNLLAPGGSFVMEAAYLFDTVLRGEFDTVYHEHVYCFSLSALKLLLEKVRLTIVGVEKIPTQGGSLRLFVQRSEDRCTPSPSVASLLKEEEERGVRDEALYLRVGEEVRGFKIRFLEELKRLHDRYGVVVGLGAPARGVVILNYCEIGPELVEVVIDDTPLKQGRVVPGVHIPVDSWERLTRGPCPGAFLLLSWNYEAEVLSKLRRFTTRSEVLIPFPEIRIRRWDTDDGHN